MKKVNAFECDFCKRLTKTRHAMKVHEHKCFKNPSSNSCITCKYLILKGCIDGKPLTEEEESILKFEVKGTYRSCIGIMEADYNDLNDEYKYLYDSEWENYCASQSIVLRKLRTNCSIHCKIHD